MSKALRLFLNEKIVLLLSTEPDIDPSTVKAAMFRLLNEPHP